MYHNTAEPKALLLSKDEALALLDVCLNSTVEMQPVHEQILTKLGDIARSYIAEEVSGQAEPVPAAMPMPAAPPAPACDTPVRIAFWTRTSLRSRLHSLPPMPEVEACR